MTKHRLIATGFLIFSLIIGLTTIHGCAIAQLALPAALRSFLVILSGGFMGAQPGF